MNLDKDFTRRTVVLRSALLRHKNQSPSRRGALSERNARHAGLGGFGLFMILAHRIQLDPTFAQRRYFVRACGTARFVWNRALDEWNQRYGAGEKPRAAMLAKAFNATYATAYPWVSEVHRDCHSRPFADLDVAFNAFFRGKAKHPTFKKRGQHDSFYLANDVFHLDGKRVRLPKIGSVRMTEALRFAGKVMGARVTRTADRWYLSVQVDIGDGLWERTSDGTVGVDLGIKHAAVTSDGQVFDGPKPLKAALVKLARANRSYARKCKGSSNRRKAAARLAKIHARVARIRQDWTHKTTTAICRANATVAIEDLNVRGMIANRRLARAISDVGFGEFRRQLEYKTALYGSTLVIADRWFPSSKTCSACGAVKAKLTLSERTYNCEACGVVMDRDLNAAMNLRTLGLRGTAGLLPANAHGPEVPRSAGLKWEPDCECVQTGKQQGSTAGRSIVIGRATGSNG